MNERHDDLQEIIDAALREMAAEEGDGFDTADTADRRSHVRAGRDTAGVRVLHGGKDR